MGHGVTLSRRPSPTAARLFLRPGEPVPRVAASAPRPSLAFEAMLYLAHGVGRVFQSPLPLWLYLFGAAATVLASFAVRARVRHLPPERPPRKVAGDRAARALAAALRAGGIAGLLLTFVVAVLLPEPGLSPAPLLFWVGLVLGTMALSCVVAGVWDAADPWAAVEVLLVATPHESGRTLEPPVFVGPLLLYGLLWFELVSGVGFQPAAIVAVLLAYGLASLSLRGPLGDRWRLCNPLSVLFGFASDIAPLELGRTGIYLRARRSRLPMHPSLFASLFVLLAGTTFDNLRETVGWFEALSATRLADAPRLLVESVVLAVLVVPFAGTFTAAVWAARRALADRRPLDELNRLFAWSLVPIAVAYILAHNVPLVITGAPALLARLSGGLVGSEALAPSPALVWFLEIVLIVGGHVLGVVTAHGVALALAGPAGRVVAGEIVLTALMCAFTIVTLWLLAQPLVAGD